MSKKKKEMSYQVPEWYIKKQAMMKDAFAIAKPKLDLATTEDSPFKNWAIERIPHKISNSGPDYCEGNVYYYDEKTERNVKVITLYRNYGNFPVVWAEYHYDSKSKKHVDYLVYAEDVQGISIVKLDRNVEKIQAEVWVPEEAKNGTAFSWREGFLSPDMTKLALYGYEDFGPPIVHFYDFKTPMKFPWKKLGTFNGIFINDELKRIEPMDRVIGWEDDNSLIITSEVEYSYKHRIPVHMLTKTQLVSLYENNEDHVITVTKTYLVTVDGSYTLIDTSNG